MPAGGVIAGITYIKNRMCIIVANDATVKAGAWMPITAKKISDFKKLPWKIVCQLFI